MWILHPKEWTRITCFTTNTLIKLKEGNQVHSNILPLKKYVSILTACHEATLQGSTLHKKDENRDGGRMQIKKHASRLSHTQTQPLPLQAPLNSWVISTQLALFFIFSGMPSPHPVSSSSTADFITIVTTKDKPRETGQRVQTLQNHQKGTTLPVA